MLLVDLSVIGDVVEQFSKKKGKLIWIITIDTGNWLAMLDRQSLTQDIIHIMTAYSNNN